MVDAQLDQFQVERLKISFDPLDVPRDKFLPGGRAWSICRSGQADPDKFGIADLHGLWFIRGNLIRDLGSLNKIELLPWDCWGIMDREESSFSPDDWNLLDHVAMLSQRGNDAFGEIRKTYEEDDRVRVPPVIRSYGGPGPPREVAL